VDHNIQHITISRRRILSGALCAEISNLLKSNKVMSFSPDGFETALFQNGCPMLRSLVKIDLPLKLKISVMSASIQARLGDL
jgi:hypothetical protein